jgi:hypothetical protein
MGAAIAPIGLVAGIGGGIMSAFGSYDSMEAQSANAAYQAQVARNNAVIAQQNANMDQEAGDIAGVNRGLKTRAQVGAQLAGQGSSGVDVNKGSFVQSRAGTSEEGMLDQLTIRSNTAKKVYADEVQATSETAQAGLLQDESEQASAAAPFAAIGSALSSASSVGGGYYKYLQTT